MTVPTSIGGVPPPAARGGPRLVVAGTDTDVGKTVFAAALARALDAYYWKPVQAGSEPETDSSGVVKLGVSPARIVREAYRLTSPLSPHRAAEIDGVTIAAEHLALTEHAPLVIEVAGGLMVPLSRHLLQIDQIAHWGLPVVLVARTALGTINHSLLSLEALRARGIPVVGVAFVGAENSDSEHTICDIAGVRHLGRLPRLDPLDAGSLADAFAANFRLEHFR